MIKMIFYMSSNQNNTKCGAEPVLLNRDRLFNEDKNLRIGDAKNSSLNRKIDKNLVL